ncbi:MAG: beta-L-arabinofuranosidase domain-containing protein [Verrucomicrobiota bacterium]
MTPAALQETKWTSGFWAERYDACRTKMVPALWTLIDGTKETHFLENFRIAAGLAEGRCRGAAWNDGETYKWLEAACSLLITQPDPTLRAHVDEAVYLIAKAQRPDGYIYTKVIIGARAGDPAAKPFSDRFAFEMYCMGHLMTASCRHHQATGDDKLLTVAKKAADFLIEHFKNPTPEQAKNSVCPSHYMGFLDLYRETGDVRYRDASQHFIDMRKLVTDGGDDNQDRIPFTEQTKICGHAVRANYLCAGAADLYLETGDKTLMTTLASMWKDLVTKKIYITGGCGALYDGASPDGSSDQKTITRTHQAYGRDYQLPNLTAHSETCANIGSVLWNWRMFEATGEARYMDLMEHTLINSVLTGVSLNGTEWSYVNPLRILDPMPLELRWDRARKHYISSFCCPPNVVRTLAQLQTMAYSKSPDTIWVNLYGGSEYTTEINGVKVKLTQETEYPWDGKVRLKVEPENPVTFTLKLRVPGWASSSSFTANNGSGKSTGPQPAAPDTYISQRWEWQASASVELNLPMPAQFIESHPAVEENRNQLAVQRGPVVYCLESPDMAGAKMNDVFISPSATLTPKFDASLLDGVAVVETEIHVRPQGDWDDKLTRPLQQTDERKIPARLIPLFAWGNRGKSEMSVWLPSR